MTWILVGLGGGFGAVARFAVDGAVSSRNRTGFPLGTLVVNAIGSLLIGFLLAWGMANERGPAAGPLFAALGTGLLGGYTTFSTASVEGARLASEGRWAAAGTHALGMLAACYAAALLGLQLGTVIWGG